MLTSSSGSWHVIWSQLTMLLAHVQFTLHGSWDKISSPGLYMRPSKWHSPSPGTADVNMTAIVVVVYGTTVVVAVVGVTPSLGTPFLASTVSSVEGVVAAKLVVSGPTVVVMSDGHSYRIGQQCPGSVGMATHPSDGALQSCTAQTTS